MEEPHWLAEAVVDFLRGPLYIHPLMTFIDAKCLCFTSDEENKFEYTTLGVTAETFYEVVAKEQDKDQLTSFVVQTILTVDDFLMFKAMMVKRNMDLTHQVLDAVEELRLAHEFD
ncbi:ARL2_Bind_BART domain-containing protein, partial [Haematococcus lacustris]